MDTIELIISVPAIDQDWIVGRLDDRASGFVKENTTLRAYVPAEQWDRNAHEALMAHLRAAGYDDALRVSPLSEKNWNAAWEDTIDPVQVGPFLVHPKGTDRPSTPVDLTTLCIEPKRSFGTGHHASTRLALALLSDAVSPGARVLDVGTGTGILAIAACLLGARSAVGVDTDVNAVENARENGAENEASDCVTIRHGSVEAAPDASYDVVVANITRATLLDLLPRLFRRMSVDGTLLLSGVLDGDRSEMKRALQTHSLTIDDEQTEDGWWAGRCSMHR